LDRTRHWDRVFERDSEGASWGEIEPAQSLALLDSAGLTIHSSLIDVGGGDSRLVDALLLRGLTRLTVLDISSRALQRAQERLGSLASAVGWIQADVTHDWTVPAQDFWHDRGAFHFLTERSDRSRYLDRLVRTLKPDGTALIATFAEDGPSSCSQLPTMRYSAEALAEELAPRVRLVRSTLFAHRTPTGQTQSFRYSLLVPDEVRSEGASPDNSVRGPAFK
jgi:ubiquinone/menaquinone biosynthesis C-methylase UbiE